MRDPDNVQFTYDDTIFLYKMDKSLAGLSGLAFDEGQFGVLGYFTDDEDLLLRLQPGDVVESVEVLAGRERLVPGKAQSVAILDDGTSAGPPMTINMMNAAVSASADREARGV